MRTKSHSAHRVRKPTTIRLSDKAHAVASATARQEGRSLSSVISGLVEAALLARREERTERQETHDASLTSLQLQAAILAHLQIVNPAMGDHKQKIEKREETILNHIFQKTPKEAKSNEL